MSDSPRKQIRRAHDALRQLEETLAKHPAAEGDLRAALGDDLLARVRAAGAAVAEAHERMKRGADDDGSA